MSLITSLEHAYAVAIGDLKKTSHFVQGPLLAVLKKVDAAAPTIEAVTALVSPGLANIERTGEALLGAAIKAITDAGGVVNADGSVSLTVAAELVADIKAIAPIVKSAANTAVVTQPAA